MKAIENGQQVNPDLFKNNSKPKTIKESLLGKLTGACVTFALGAVLLVFGIIGCVQSSWVLSESPAVLLAISGAVLLAIGLALFIIFLVGKKMLAREIAAEESNTVLPE